MNMLDIIRKKRDREILNEDEISLFIEGYVSGKIPDYQVAALLMAIYLNGMTELETVTLTMKMADSGSKIEWAEISRKMVDKHSTGGVGDKTTLVVAPLVASFGVPVGKLSGRGLGYTGGTIDKLESIPGFNTTLSVNQIKKQVKDISVVISGQTEDVAVADKKLYALRDVTATVESIPLIVSSIMSKKIAGGSDAFVFDVKIGRGALMKDMSGAERLADMLLKVSKLSGHDAVAILSNMEQPLGMAVGNAIEVVEAIETMKGRGPSDFRQLCKEVAFHMLKVGGMDVSEKEVLDAMEGGRALEKFKELIEFQGGDSSVVDDYSVLPSASKRLLIESDKEGYVSRIDAMRIGIAAMRIGAGRRFKGDVIDHSVGIRLLKKVGDRVEKKEPCIEVLYNDDERLKEAEIGFSALFEVSEKPVDRPEVVLRVLK